MIGTEKGKPSWTRNDNTVFKRHKPQTGKRIQHASLVPWNNTSIEGVNIPHGAWKTHPCYYSLMIKRKLQNTVSPFSKQEIPKNSTLRKALECELSGWPLKNHRSLWKWRQTGSRGKERSGREGQRAWAAGGKPVSSKNRTKTDRGPPMWEQRAMGRDEGGRGREAWYPSQAPLEAGRWGPGR